MPSKVLKNSEVSRGFIRIPFKDQEELFEKKLTPFKTKLNQQPATVDRYGRLWSTFLRHRYPVGTRIIISKNDNSFQISADENQDNLRKLQIDYKKTCACPQNRISCVTPKEWVKGMVAIQAFYYTARDVRDKDIHPAVYPIALPAHFIRLLTHEGELILDPFVGIGTTLLAARDLNRNAAGFDLKKEYVTVAQERLSEPKKELTQQLAILDDAHNIPQYFERESISLCITSPPYSKMLNRPRFNKSIRGCERVNNQYLKVQQYSNDTRDLGTMEHEEYSKALEEIYAGILPLLRNRAHCIVNVNDLWWENKRYLTHSSVIDALQRAGLEFRNTFIWDKRNLVNRVGIFGWPNNFISLGATMEYILDFWKP